MDDNDKKTIIEKLVDTVKNVTSDIATTALATKMDPREPKLEAGKGNEQLYMPTTDAAAMPLPLAPKKRPASQKADRTEPDLSGRITPTYEIPLPGPMSPMGNSVRDDRKKAAKKTAPKVAIKTGKKSGKKSAAKKSNKPKNSKPSSAFKLGRTKTVKKAAKKRPKKAKR
jgi:hypothetical protein